MQKKRVTFAQRKQERVEDLEASVAYFAAGNKKESERQAQPDVDLTSGSMCGTISAPLRRMPRVRSGLPPPPGPCYFPFHRHRVEHPTLGGGARADAAGVGVPRRACTDCGRE